MTASTLKNLTMLNTRPEFEGANQILSEKILNLGGQSIQLPLQRIEPLHSGDWLASLENAPPIDIMIFVSQPSVSCFFKSMSNSLPANLSHTKFIAIGSATAKKLQQFVTVSHFEALATSEHLLNTLNQQDLNNQHITIVRGLHGRDLLQNQLEQSNALVTPLNVYQSVAINYPIEELKFLWEDNTIDIILITSVQALKQLWNNLPLVGKQWLKQKLLLVFSERIQASAHQLIGGPTFVTNHDKIIESLLHLKESYFERS